MFKNLPTENQPKPNDPSNPCGWTHVGYPQNGLRLVVLTGRAPLRVGQEIELFASGGPTGGPYASMGTLTRLDASNGRMWSFKASAVGFACVKVLDQGMAIDSPCDDCWLPLYVAPATTGTGTGTGTGTR
jgi:hypothetical protein